MAPKGYAQAKHGPVRQRKSLARTSRAADTQGKEARCIGEAKMSSALQSMAKATQGEAWEMHNRVRRSAETEMHRELCEGYELRSVGVEAQRSAKAMHKLA